jgi:hypothetical protein
VPSGFLHSFSISENAFYLNSENDFFSNIFQIFEKKWCKKMQKKSSQLLDNEFAR